MPTENMTSCAASSPASWSSAVGIGASRSTIAAAPSCRVPCGLPSAVRSIRPSGGSGVEASIPASARARLLAHIPCPSRLLSSAGRSGTTASSCSRLGQPRSKSLIDQPEPRIQGRSGFASA